MLICEKCKRQTPSGESIGKFTVYKVKKYENGTIGKEADSAINTCFQCNGSRVKK